MQSWARWTMAADCSDCFKSGRQRDASRPARDCWRRKHWAVPSTRRIRRAMSGRAHRHGPHGQSGHGASQIRRRTAAVAERGRSCAATQTSARTQNRQYCTGRRARSAACGSKRQESCAPAWNWPAYRSAKELRETMAKKSRHQGARQGLKSHLRLYKLQKGAFDEFAHNFA